MLVRSRTEDQSRQPRYEGERRTGGSKPARFVFQDYAIIGAYLDASVPNSSFDPFRKSPFIGASDFSP